VAHICNTQQYLCMHVNILQYTTIFSQCTKTFLSTQQYFLSAQQYFSVHNNIFSVHNNIFSVHRYFFRCTDIFFDAPIFFSKCGYICRHFPTCIVVYSIFGHGRNTKRLFRQRLFVSENTSIVRKIPRH
jgi:hypothetical protein